MADHAVSSDSSGHAAKRVSKDRMWPLDLCIAGLAGLVLYLLVTRMPFDDSPWQYNGWTYAIAIPLIAIALAFVLRSVASRYVQRSVQIGFLFSVSLHLLMLMLATGVIIFSRYYPQAVMGTKPERSPISRTVPEYLFKTTEKRESQPDWSKPTETETASVVIPRQQRQLPPVQESAPQLEMPQPQQPIRRPDRPHLKRSDLANEAQPQTSDSPARMASRRELSDIAATTQQQSQPEAPSVPATASPTDTAVSRSLQSIAKSKPSVSSPNLRSQPDLVPRRSTEVPLAGLRREEQQLPQIGDTGLSRPGRNSAAVRRESPAGSAPAPRSVAIARDIPTAERMLTPDVSATNRFNDVAGARLTPGQAARSTVIDQIDVLGSKPIARNSPGASAGMPVIRAGEAAVPTGRSRLADRGRNFNPAGTAVDLSNIASASNTKGSDADSASSSSNDEIASPIASTDLPTRRTSRSVSSAMPQPTRSPSLDLMLDDGPIGFGDREGKIAGVVPTIEQPTIASIDLTTGRRPKRDIGGPVTPFGTKVAAVESFSRRIMRTNGGQAPTPAGLVGPATEEAIERGLAFLDGIQNADGSWSLQRQGTQVVLRSDSAATGLSLLAFQGAGYTHKQHQYADTVSRALQFLIQNQRDDGDLYRAENPLSDRNVAFYSHGIAALALCEAYGMTQDPELREPAQRSLNFIADTQHRSRGGWRYTPQVSSDTSVTGWMMMALKSGELSGLDVSETTYEGIQRWLSIAQASPDQPDRYRYNPYAPNTPTQRHGRRPTPTMTAVGMLMRMYSGWRRESPAMRSAADYLLEYPPQMGTPTSPQRDGYYWYYATQVMFHMGGEYWNQWNQDLNSVLLDSQLDSGTYAGSWDPKLPVPDRWSVHAGRLYVTTMNLLNLEVYYRHLPIYEETAE